MIPKGYRVVPVKVDLVSGGGSLILPGDRVDVMVHLVTRSRPRHSRDGDADDPARHQGLRRQRRGGPGEGKDGGKSIAAKTISLLVTPEQAAKVMLATQMGIVNLVMRSPEDDQQSAERPGAGRASCSAGRPRANATKKP